ncbi:MAG: (cytosine-5)-methyltransferase 1 [Blastocatellia bacterium]|jgi:DNA (cytosine-5)-methyltransferase 1|nr:(cytosine-5)-methyltransferase 1 [Blastocatellia bacterium]
MPDFYEFFAGGGMVRTGLGPDWQCLFANDFDNRKAASYRANFRDDVIRTDDVADITLANLPGRANLAWASFPCQDLSLAGAGAGLRGDRSGTFWPFWNLMKGLASQKRPADLIVLENVCGTLTSHNGKDFASICRSFVDLGYSVGALVIDAKLFVPQSRARLFIVGVHEKITIPTNLISQGSVLRWHNKALTTAYAKLPRNVQDEWIWWNLPSPRTRRLSLADIIEENPVHPEWFTVAENKRLLAMMSDLNREKLRKAKSMKRRVVGGIYKRTRSDENGHKVQRAEIRFDEIAGCLRTPAGGSSRQVILIVEGDSVRARLISARETARLMGLRDSYLLPENYNEAYHLTGDGVVVPVVRHLAKFILEPVLDCIAKTKSMAA